MQDTLVRPVLKRVNSVKSIGNAVLDSRMSNFAADQLDSALEVADKYVDKYLPSHISTNEWFFSIIDAKQYNFEVVKGYQDFLYL